MFKIVEFTEENNVCEIIQDRWMIGDDATYFPPLSKYNSFINNMKTDFIVIKKWKIFKTKIIKDNITSYNSAREATKFLSEYGDSENERNLKTQKSLKRRHPINFGDENRLDLRKYVKKLKQNPEENYRGTSSSVIHLPSSSYTSPPGSPYRSLLGSPYVSPVSAHTSPPPTRRTSSPPTPRTSPSPTPRASPPTHASPSPSTTLNVQNIADMNTEIEFTMHDSNTAIIIEISKMLEQLKKDLIVEIKNQITIALTSKNSTVTTDLSKFQKIGSINDFKEFIKKLDDVMYMNNLAAMLKLLHNSSGCYVEINGKVATIMSFLFNNDFIKEHLSWGEMNGRPSQKICLANYGKFFDLIMEVVGADNEKSIRSAFQLYFKHKAKKL